MEKKYKIFTIAIVFIMCLLIIYTYLFSYHKSKEIYGHETREVITCINKRFLKDTVNNILIEMDTKRKGKQNYYQKVGDKIYRILSEQVELTEEEFIEFFKEQFTDNVTAGAFKYLLWDKTTNKIISNPSNIDTDKKDIRDQLESYHIINHGNIGGIFGVNSEHINNNVKIEIEERIKNMRFENDAYIWVNEVIDYEGGDNYAIRRIHPNLPETEGMYLSTDMKDIKGNLPYLEELEAIKSKGELFFTYYFKKLNSEEIEEKLSYAKLYEDYDWIIAMGVHTDDIENCKIRVEDASKTLMYKYTVRLSVFIVMLLLVGNFVLVALEKRKHKFTRESLECEVNEDVLTGAYSRRRGTQELEMSFKKYKRGKENTAIMLFDLDDFKSINDNYGHDFGDYVLKNVVDAVYKTIRNSDIVIRWGGDEFICILKDIEADSVIQVANKILMAISSLPLKENNEIIDLTISAGISYFNKEDQSFNDAVVRADNALYKSKTEGKNRVNLYMQEGD